MKQIARPTTKEEYAYSFLRQAILSCDLAPGQKLVIDQLSLEMDLSPIPIRAALQRLSAEGLVVITPHTGAVVSSASPESISEVFTLLAALEQTAVRGLSSRRVEAGLPGLRQLVIDMDKAVATQDSVAWTMRNFDFHVAMAEMAGMPLLVELTTKTLESWLRLSRCYFDQVAASRRSQAQEEHWQMVALLEAGDFLGLEELVGQHNDAALDSYQDLLFSGKLKSQATPNS
jgi:DNA-binding GntR family transcriptional regulator